MLARMKLSSLLVLSLLLACAPATPLDAPPIEGAPVVAPQGQGWCTEYTLSTCEPNDAAARAICVRLFGEAWEKAYGSSDATAMECFDSTEAAAWGCEQAEGFSIVCPGAEETPSDHWCCPW